MCSNESARDVYTWRDSCPAHFWRPTPLRQLFLRVLCERRGGRRPVLVPLTRAPPSRPVPQTAPFSQRGAQRFIRLRARQTPHRRKERKKPLGRSVRAYDTCVDCASDSLALTRAFCCPLSGIWRKCRGRGAPGRGCKVS